MNLLSIKGEICSFHRFVLRSASFPAAGFGEMAQKPLQTDGGLLSRTNIALKSVKSKERSRCCFANEFTAHQELQVTADG